jgi:hypothetical protein
VVGNERHGHRLAHVDGHDQASDRVTASHPCHELSLKLTTNMSHRKGLPLKKRNGYRPTLRHPQPRLRDPTEGVSDLVGAPGLHEAQLHPGAEHAVEDPDGADDAPVLVVVGVEDERLQGGGGIARAGASSSGSAPLETEAARRRS